MSDNPAGGPFPEQQSYPPQPYYPGLALYQLGDRFQQPWRSSNVGLGYVAMVLLGLNVVAEIRRAIVDFSFQGLVAEQDFDAIVAASNGELPWELAGVGLALSTAVVFLLWQYRLWTSDRSNALVYTRSAGFAVGGWFIPFANFALAPRALRDLWWGTFTARPGSPPTPAIPNPRYKIPGLVAGWLAVWVVSAVLAVLSSQALTSASAMSAVADIASALNRGLTLEIIGSGASIAAAVLMITYIASVQSFTKR